MSMSAFLRENAVQPVNQKVIISDRFPDENGNPTPFEIKAISETEDSELKKICTYKSIFKGRQTTTFDNQRYLNKLIAASTVFPDLKDAELQKSYGVTSDDDLVREMLISGEHANLLQAVNEINGFDAEKVEEAKEEVKNS
nr:phage portal protein [uncultured Caproiciproducens sp.]